MKLYIPDIGDQFVLTRDWEFALKDETRNDSVISSLGLLDDPEYIAFEKERSNLYRTDFKAWHAMGTYSWKTMLPKDTILKVDRVYIRKGKDMSEFSSLTFFIVKTSDLKLQKETPFKKYPRYSWDKSKPATGMRRFFAHLNDINQIHCEFVT